MNSKCTCKALTEQHAHRAQYSTITAG